MGTWWSSWGFAAGKSRKVCLLTVPCKCASSPIRRLFGRSGFSGNIPWKWRHNCKHNSLFRLLKEGTSCNLCGWRFRSRSRMRPTLMSDVPYSWACSLAGRLGLRPMDVKTRTLLSGVQTEDGRPGRFLHTTEPFSRHCLIHRRIAFGDGASCRLI